MRRWVVALCALGLTACFTGCSQAAAPAPEPAGTPAIPVAAVSAPPPVPETPEPSPPPSVPVMAGSYASLLQGDVSVILDEEDRERLAFAFSHINTPEFNPIFELSNNWEYTLLDFDGDGTDELYLRPADAWYVHYIFHAEETGLRLWDGKDVGMYYWCEPLTDGRILQTINYDGAYSYSIDRFDAEGNRAQTGETWFYRYEDRVQWIGPGHEAPAWEHNEVHLTEEDFNTQFQREVEDCLINDWKQIQMITSTEEETP